jgi:tetratricopeptide (TPR) repeat protein
MTNQIRVFLSSTFVDFARERELVHAEVVPTLEAMCRHFGLSLELSDLRWGVTVKDIDQNRTATICLEEVDLCRQVSPELNFLLLLGDRVGSRFIPEQVSAHTLETLLAELARVVSPGSEAHILIERLRLLFPTYRMNRAGVLLRDDSPSAQALTKTFLQDPTAARLLTSFSCADPSVEELRRTLAYSLTHQEVFRSRALAQPDRNEGAIAIIRALDQPEELQHRMRVAVSRAFGVRAAELSAVKDKQGKFDSSYESDFVRCCTMLLGARIEAARERGSKSHHFAQIPSLERDLPHQIVCSHVQALETLRLWIWSDSGPCAAAISGGLGAGKTTTLRQAKSIIQSLVPNCRIVHLEVKSTPELQSLRNLAITLIVWASSSSLNEAKIEALLSCFVPDLLSQVIHELVGVESTDRLFVLIDDLDLVHDGGARAALSWLWLDAYSRKVLFTCGTRLVQELHESANVQLIPLNDLSATDSLCIAKEACKKHGAEWLDATWLAEASQTHSTPGYINTLVQAALQVDDSELEGWAMSGPTEFFRDFLNYLQESAPFSRSIYSLFLSLSACTEHGVAEREFLSICYNCNEIREELKEHFPLSPFASQVPPLVWHRLTRHFAPAIERVGRAGTIASHVRTEYVDMLIEDVGSVFLRSCKEQLAEHFLANLSKPTYRAALMLPNLLVSIQRDELLAQLVLAQPFMKVSVSYDLAETLIHAIARSQSHDGIVREIVQGAIAPNKRSAEEQSHWLLDLSVLTRGLGHYGEGANLAKHALEIRKSHLGNSHPLTVAAVHEATDCYLEAGEYAKAELLCKAALEAANQDHDLAPALLRIKNHLASALSYQKRYDEAETILRELMTLYENNGGEDRELCSVYNGLVVCSAKRCALGEARRYATNHFALTSKIYGERSLNAAIGLVNLGAILLEAKLHSEAVSIFERALRIYSGIRDLNHPWAMNAAVGYFSALSESARVPEAIEFLAVQLARITHFDDCAVWIQQTIRTILQVIDAKDATRFRSLLMPMNNHAAALPEKSWTGSLAARAAQKTAGVLGFKDEMAAKGLLVSGIFLWILAVLAATLRDLITRHEAKLHLRVLEDRLAAIFGIPTSFFSLQDKMKMAWQVFAGECVTRGDCERLLWELCPPPTPANLLTASEAQELKTPSINEMGQRADNLDESAGKVSDERGQSLILLAARSAAAGQYEKAIAAQTEAARIASELYGPDSRQYGIATVNVGALFFRASRYAEAFEHYRKGIIRALHDGASVDELSGSMKNMVTAGFKTQKFSETGHSFGIFAELVSPLPAAINFWFIASAALARTGDLAEAVDVFARALALHSEMSPQEGEAWLEPILIHAGGLSQQLDTSEKARIRSILRDLANTAKTKGWFESLRKTPRWMALQVALDL